MLRVLNYTIISNRIIQKRQVIVNFIEMKLIIDLLQEVPAQIDYNIMKSD